MLILLKWRSRYFNVQNIMRSVLVLSKTRSAYNMILKNMGSEIFFDVEIFDKFKPDDIYKYRYLILAPKNEEEKAQFLTIFSKLPKERLHPKFCFLGFLNSSNNMGGETTEFFEELILQLKSYVNKIKDLELKDVVVEKVETIDSLLKLEQELKGKDFSMDTETSSDGDSDLQYFKGGRVLCATFCCDYNKGYYVPIYIKGSAFVGKESLALDAIKRIMQDQQAKYIGHNTKFDMNWLRFVHGIECKNFHMDTMLMFFFLRDNVDKSCGLKEVTEYMYGCGDYEAYLKDYFESLKYRTYSKKLTKKEDIEEAGSEYITVKERIKLVNKEGKKVQYEPRWGDIPSEIMYKYATYDSIFTFRLYKDFIRFLEFSPLKERFYRFMDYCYKATILFHNIEIAGTNYDTEARSKLDIYMPARLEALKKHILLMAKLTINDTANFVDKAKWKELYKKFHSLNKKEKYYAEDKFPGLSSMKADDAVYTKKPEDANEPDPPRLKSYFKSILDVRSNLYERCANRTLSLAGMEFLKLVDANLDPLNLDLDSKDTLRWIMFDFLKLPSLEKSEKTKKESVNKRVLKILSNESEVCAFIYSRNKLKTTYGMFIKKYAELPGIDGYIHPSFLVHGTATSRISSQTPNFQQLVTSGSIRDIVSGVKACFIPVSKENVILSIDQSQVELRVMAAYAKEQLMIDAFKRGEDIHLWVASHLYRKEQKEVTKAERRVAKTGSFAVVYRASAKSIAASFGLDLNEVERFLALYFSKFPNLVSFQEEIIAFAKEHGFIETKYGFIRQVPEINTPHGEDENKEQRKEIDALIERGKRVAVNTPIQGSSSNLCVLDAYGMMNDLEAAGIKNAIKMLVHDAVVLDVPKSRVPEVLEIAKKHMEKTVDWMEGCPLKIDVEIGASYGLMVKYEDYLKDESILDKNYNEYWKFQEENCNKPIVNSDVEDLVHYLDEEEEPEEDEVAV